MLMISVLMLSLAGRQGCLGQYSVLTNTFSGAVWWADSSGRRQGGLCAPHAHLSIHSRMLPAALPFPQQPRARSERIKKPDALAASRPRLSPPLCAAFLRYGTAPSLRAHDRARAGAPKDTGGDIPFFMRCFSERELHCTSAPIELPVASANSFNIRATSLELRYLQDAALLSVNIFSYRN